MIIAMADAHLEQAIRKDVRELTGDSYRALSDVKSLIISKAKECQRRNPHEEIALLIAGDLTDKTRITGGTVEALRGFVNDLIMAGVAVYGVEGNHDVQNQNVEKPVPFIRAVGGTSLNEKLISVSGLTVYGLDWRSSDKLQEALKKVPPCDILVMHAPFQHLLPFDEAWDVRLEDIPKHVRCVIAGDIHKAQYLPGLADRPAFLSPGSIHPCDMSQDGDHGVFFGEVNLISGVTGSNYTKLSWTQGVIPSRQMLSLVLPAEMSEEAQIETFLLGLLQHLPKVADMKPIIKITYPPERGEALRHVLTGKQLSGRAIYIPEPRYSGKLCDSRPAIDIKLESLSLREAIPLVADPVTDKTTYELLVMAAESKTFGSDLDSWISEKLAGATP